MMRRLVLVGLIAGQLWAETLEVPFEEYKALLREHIVRELDAKPKVPVPIYMVDHLRYTLAVQDNLAQGVVTVSGRWLSGTPAPIRLLDPGLRVLAIESETNGKCMASSMGLSFLPEALGEFSLTLQVLARADSEADAHVLDLSAAAPCLSTSLHLSLAADTVLLPGSNLIETGDGNYLADSSGRLRIRYGPASTVPAPTIRVDAISTLRFRGSELRVSTLCSPLPGCARDLLVELPPAASGIHSDAQTQVRILGDGRCELRIPAGNASFAFGFSLPLSDESCRLALPRLVGNVGLEGYFHLLEDDDHSITVSGEGIRADVSALALPMDLRQAAEIDERCAHAPPDSILLLSRTRHAAVARPDLVLDEVALYTSFDESGSNLSVLRLSLPKGAGRRLRISRPPNASLWSARLGDTELAVFADSAGNWLISVPPATAGQLELAFVREGPVLGAHGKLEVLLPEIDLPTQRFVLAVALPERVHLLAPEGAISPSGPLAQKPPAGFTGQSYYFARAFHNGSAMRIGLYYKEPPRKNP
ncbi:MAG: hypothetical protein ACI8W8_000117 [Rhodothermales bacterium]|jgi:hypothetical protein